MSSLIISVGIPKISDILFMDIPVSTSLSKFTILKMRS